MERREALRLLATGTLLQFAPSKLLSVLREARMSLQPEAAPRRLNAHQDATLKAMAELILPRTETPGAADVGASEFIELMLTEWYDESDRAGFLNGLADVDSRTRFLFGRDFVDCSPGQQAEILASLGEKMAEGTGSVRSARRPRRGITQEVNRNFYFILRQLTLTAYYTSEAGATAELNFQVIPDRYDGCAKVQDRAQSEGQENK
jgi:hypothetical protein